MSVNRKTHFGFLYFQTWHRLSNNTLSRNDYRHGPQAIGPSTIITIISKTSICGRPSGKVEWSYWINYRRHSGALWSNVCLCLCVCFSLTIYLSLSPPLSLSFSLCVCVWACMWNRKWNNIKIRNEEIIVNRVIFDFGRQGLSQSREATTQFVGQCKWCSINSFTFEHEATAKSRRKSEIKSMWLAHNSVTVIRVTNLLCVRIDRI